MARRPATLRRAEGAAGCRGDGQACGSDLPLPGSPCRSLPAASSACRAPSCPVAVEDAPARVGATAVGGDQLPQGQDMGSGMALIARIKKAATEIKEVEGGGRRARSPRSSWASTAGASASTPTSSCSASSCPGSARWTGHHYWGCGHYMKDQLERIERLEEKMEEQNQNALLSSLMELNRNEMLGQGTPKVEVDLRQGEVPVQIYCAAKLGQFLTTVNTLDTLGLHI